MQTGDILVWGVGQGWKRELLHEYFADLGLSGTLRPDQRPDMFRLFEDIDAGKFDNGTIICFQENRLFRDETEIYYNQFIDKCLQHNIHVVVISPRLTIYDLRDQTLREMLRAKLKEAGEYIPKHVIGWLHPARERAAWIYGEWAGLGGLPPGFIVDYDLKSETYKMPIPYWSHIEKSKEMFQLFMELGGDTNLFFNRLRKSPIVYPEFESWVDRRNVNMFHLSKYPGGGYYIKSPHSLENLLTHPLHYGYRPVNNVIRRDEHGEKIREFKPVMDLDLLDFAYYRLAKTDFDGNPIPQSKQPRRYFQKDSDDTFGLVKYRIISNQGVVRTRRGGVNNSAKRGKYVIETVNEEEFLLIPIWDTTVTCEEIDDVIVKRLMEHVRDISKKRETAETYQEHLNEIRKKRQNRIKQLTKSVMDIETKQQKLTAQLEEDDEEENTVLGENTPPEDELKKKLRARREELILERIDKLEIERQTLLDTIEQLREEAANDIGSLDEELEALEQNWADYTFERRRTLINFIIREVVIDSMSTHWVRIQVLWLHEEWGREEMFYHRRVGKRRDWCDEEKQVIAEHYLSLSRTQLMALLPDRTWNSILLYGSRTFRNKGERTASQETMPGWTIDYSHSDLTFMRENSLEGVLSSTNWVAASALPQVT